MNDREALNRWRRHRRHEITKPRVSWCAMTRKWIVSPDGRRHTCSASWKSDVAFRRWPDAIREALLIYRDRAEGLAWMFVADDADLDL